MRWLIWTAYVIIWTLMLVLPAPDPKDLPGTEFIITYRMLVTKGIHVSLYVLFTVLSGWVRVPLRYRWLMMFAVMAHATITELLQLALEPYCHRTGQLTDVGFDTIGILIGVCVSWKWWTSESASRAA